MSWVQIHKGDKRALELADRHYTRQKPGSNQFCRPGKNLVLLTEDEKALWVTWCGIRDDGWNAWECTIFRNEGSYLSSHLIVMALGITKHLWGVPPADGIITYVGAHLKGGCFHAAGFKKAGWSKKGKLLLQLPIDRMPPALQPAEDGLFRHDIVIA
ncbi:hypothetical protein [Brevibacillus laterosporus]|uniref:hypothetical protein n=1 Tax=Brevibacillus laterosporus TaxID=1465 RepID=UPI000E6B951A|nr:hypothetical protein [Brevibacillus laterosporus]AYB39993.1 hypothetical protein D5F52_17945 [Brevibacillus laterosporus]MBM7108391.1 hypothetical protein [Brevibacillus laterosporus]